MVAIRHFSTYIVEEHLAIAKHFLASINAEHLVGIKHFSIYIVKGVKYLPYFVSFFCSIVVLPSG
jgi:hypothetical protein